MRRGHAIAVLVALLSGCGMASAALCAATSAPAVPADDRLKTAFEALLEPERRAIQDALLWTGDYVGVVNGTFGPRTRDALTAYGKKNAQPPEAVLDPKIRPRLMAAAAAARTAVGFTLVKDKPAGVAVSLPLKLLPRKTATESGTHYASVDGAIVVDTVSRPAGPGGLGEVFDRMSVTSAQRKVTYKLLKPDFFVVSGEIADRKFYSRFVLGVLDAQPLVRGLTLAYPKTEAGRLDAVALATAASFDAFPATATAAAAQPPLPPAPPKPPATFAITGILVAPTLALTHLPGEACGAPSLAGAPLSLHQSDKATGLVLFDVAAGRGASPILASAPVTPEMPLLALFRHDPDGIDIAPATLQPTPSAGRFTISAGVQGRAEGMPVIDRQGRLAGIATEPKRLSPSVAGTRLENDYPVVDAGRLKTFLDQAGVVSAVPPEAAPKNLGAVAALWKPLLIRIVCQLLAAP